MIGKELKNLEQHPQLWHLSSKRALKMGQWKNARFGRYRSEFDTRSSHTKDLKNGS